MVVVIVMKLEPVVLDEFVMSCSDRSNVMSICFRLTRAGLRLNVMKQCTTGGYDDWNPGGHRVKPLSDRFPRFVDIDRP